MKVSNSIDLLLLNKFQRVSDWMQDYFGYNNFDIARVLRILMIISFVIREVIAFLNGIDSSEGIVILCSAAVIIKMEFMVQQAQQSVKRNPAFVNPAVGEQAITRLMMQIVGVAAFGFLLKHTYYIINPSVNIAAQFDNWKEFFWDMFGTLMFFVSYFSSCTPKPYKPSKAKKLIEQTTNKITTASLSKLRLA